jgi:hypothetical protein
LFQRDGMRDGVVGHQLSRGFLQVDHGGSVTESRVLGRKGGSTGLLGAVLWLSPGCSLAGQGARCQPDTSTMDGMHCVQFRLIAKIINDSATYTAHGDWPHGAQPRCHASPEPQGRSIGWVPSAIAVVPSGDGRAAAGPGGLV